MAKYTNGPDTIEVAEGLAGGHTLELLGWVQVSDEEVVTSQGDASGDEPDGDTDDDGEREAVEGGGPEDLEDLTNEQLREALGRRELSTKGKKEQLVERLKLALDTELLAQNAE